MIVVASLLLDGNEANLEQVFDEDDSCQRLGIGKDAAPELMSAYREKLQSMQQSLS